MITVLLGIAFVVTIIGIVGGCINGWSDGVWYALSIVGAILVLIFGTIFVCDTQTLATADTINQKIQMYEEENTEIEAKMDELVKYYMEYEKDTYESLKAESSITLISYFPELKSDEMVKKQLDVYYQNAADIKALREELIDISKAKWRVYFGH